MYKQRLSAILLSAALITTAISPALAAGYPEAENLPALNTTQHDKFMDGSSDGLFHPAQLLSRCEAAQILYQLLSEKPAFVSTFSDVPTDAWYASAVGALEGLGLLEMPEDGLFRPEQPITRAEFAVLLSHFTPEGWPSHDFVDVTGDHPAYEAICSTTAYGLFSGYPDGSFHPDDGITRAEAATVFNKLLGRAPDAGTIDISPNTRFFPDLPTDHWAYYQIMEATISHQYITAPEGEEWWTTLTFEPTALSDGYHLIDGQLYRVKDGAFVRSATLDGFTFGADGQYTCGSDSLDAQLVQIVKNNTTSAMTQEQKLRALYEYCRDNFTYLKRPLVSKEQTGWEVSYAEEFLRLGKGNCYSFSALFCLLARQIGYGAYTVVGSLGGQNGGPHGWVEIPMDGVNYMFDPQFEWRNHYQYGKTQVNLFKMNPNNTPFVYIR